MHKSHFKNYNCWINGNTIRFANMTNQRLIPEFINSLTRLIYKFEHKRIILDFEEVNTVFPLPIVPIISYIDFFKTKEHIDFEFINLSGYLKHINVFNPNSAEKLIENNNSKCLDKIWSFDNSDHVHVLSSFIIRDIRRTIICEEGTLDACRWGTNEIMDNVIQHSDIKRGFIMAQIQKSNKSVNICIFDYGIGIYKSLKGTENNPKNAIDAIMLSVKEGVTRDKQIGQGNGLWGLFNMVAQNDGHLSIICLHNPITVCIFAPYFNEIYKLFTLFKESWLIIYEGFNRVPLFILPLIISRIPPVIFTLLECDCVVFFYLSHTKQKKQTSLFEFV